MESWEDFGPLLVLAMILVPNQVKELWVREKFMKEYIGGICTG